MSGHSAGTAAAAENPGRRLPDGKYPLFSGLATAGIRGLCEVAAEDFVCCPQDNRKGAHTF
jgi:hypothetical protein